MMTRPASLGAQPCSDPAAELGALLSSLASAARNGFVTMFSRSARPARLPPKELRYPLSGRAKRLMRSDD